MMYKFIATICLLLLLFSPISASASQSLISETFSNNLISVFFFGDQYEGNRTKKVQGSNTTIYVSKYYEIDPSGKITKHIYGVDDRIALVETLSGVKTPYYVHKDHLGGSSVITDSSGNKVELVDYYPYGSTRLDEKAGSFESKYKFTGKELDGETGLYYYGQRYYDPAIGRFVSEDPAHLLIGDTKFKSRFERDLSQHLTDPQGLNSYSYANNNPLKYTDPDGEIIPLIALSAIMWAATEIGISAYDAYSTVKDLGNSNLSTGQKLGSVGLFAAGLAMPGGGYKTAVDKAGDVARSADKAIDTAKQTITKIHGNSLDSPKQTTLYQLVDKNTGAHLKYGITSKEIPIRRYTQEFMSDKRMLRLETGGRREMHAKETQMIKSNPRGPLQKNNH